MSEYLFNREIAELAVRMALPTIRMMRPIASWGPAGVVIGVDGPGLEEPYIHVMEELYNDDDQAYGDQINEFRGNVYAKLRPAARTGRGSRQMLFDDPAGLHLDDSLYVGSVVDGSLRVAASGWYSEADEAVAWIVVNCAHFICRMIAKKMQESDHAFVREAVDLAYAEVVSKLA